jgi:hypothetical protein
VRAPGVTLPDLISPASGRKRGWWAALPAALVLVGLVSAWWAALRLPLMLAPRARPSWEAGDIDTTLIHEGLVQAPHIPDPLRWWVGPWVGQVPFYRPLTSYLFWAQWKLFGNAEQWYDLCALLAHVGAALLFAVLVFRLAERHRAPAATVASALGGLLYLGLFTLYRPTIVAAVLTWKNQPDTFAALCCMASVLCYLRALDGSRAALAGAALRYLAACCFKEVAFTLPLVLGALELGAWPSGSARGALLRLGTAAAASALFFCARWLALGTLGYTYGSNGSWLSRTALHALGPIGEVFAGGEWLPPLLGLLLWSAALFAARVAGRRSREVVQHRGAGALLLFALGWVVLGWARFVSLGREASLDPWTGDGVLAGMMLGFTPASFEPAVGTAWFLTCLTLAWTRHRWAFWLALAWTFAFLLPLTVSPGPGHRYYLAQAGYLFTAALALSELSARAWEGSCGRASRK